MTWNRTSSSVVRSRRITAWTVPWPLAERRRKWSLEDFDCRKTFTETCAVCQYVPHVSTRYNFPLNYESVGILWKGSSFRLDAPSEEWVCGCSRNGITGSNPAGSMDVCLLWMLCVGQVQVQASATGRSVFQESPTESVCVCVCVCVCFIEFGHVQQKPSTPTMSGLKKSKEEVRQEGMKKERKKERRKERKNEFPFSVKQPYDGDRGSNGHLVGSCVRGQTMKPFSNPFLLVSCFPSMLLRYCLSDSETAPFAPLIIGITFAFTFHICWICIISLLLSHSTYAEFVLSLYFRIFSAFFTFLSPEVATSINMSVPFSLSWTMMSSLLLGMVLSVHIP